MNRRLVRVLFVISVPLLAIAAVIASHPPARAGRVTTTAHWTPIGPNYIWERDCAYSDNMFAANGRVNSLAVDPTYHSRIYLGSAGGGVWVSDDQGLHWKPLTDQKASLGIGSSHAIAVDPKHPNTIYAGTSSFALLAESLPRPIDYTQSQGILKSTNYGATWTVLGSKGGNALKTFSHTDINTIIVDPKKSNILYLAAGRCGSQPVLGGLYFSTNGGKKWTAGVSGENIYAESLVLDTSSLLKARVLYAGVNGAGAKQPNYGGVMKSKDGGKNWSYVLDYSAVQPYLPNGFTKTIVALAPASDPPNPKGQVLYACLLDNTCPDPPDPRCGEGHIFESTDGGATWVHKKGEVSYDYLNPPPFTRLIGGAFSDMAVDPLSPGDGVNDHIYWGGATQFISRTSGDYFNEIGQRTGTHGDHQTWLLVPNFSTRTSFVYAGDDGGVWKTTDDGIHWTGTSLVDSPPTINANGLQTAIIYALAVRTDGNAILAGSQDNGLLTLPFPGSDSWGGTSNDAMDVAFDKEGNAYSVQNGCDGDCIMKAASADGYAVWTNITSNIPLKQRDTFRNRLAVDAYYAGVLYVGGSRGKVFRSMDAGATYSNIFIPGSDSMYVSSLDVAPSCSDDLVFAANASWASADNVAHTVQITRQARAAGGSLPSFSDITSNLPPRFVTRVAFDPHDASVVYAALSGLGSQTPTQRGHVFRTSTVSLPNTWTDISPKADVPVNAMVVDGSSTPSVLYIGTDHGVLRSLFPYSKWDPVDPTHLPNAAVSDMAVNAATGVLVASTWGRGVFAIALW